MSDIGFEKPPQKLNGVQFGAVFGQIQNIDVSKRFEIDLYTLEMMIPCIVGQNDDLPIE